uniref:Uncharacterized protein n=1 Tax=viral metagenome TaxID=1070528 RepID=A0A6H1Z7R7_9ZZZZ
MTDSKELAHEISQAIDPAIEGNGSHVMKLVEDIIDRHLAAWAKEREEIIGECIEAVEKGCTRDQLPPDDLDGQYLVYQHGREDALAALHALEGETT